MAERVSELTVCVVSLVGGEALARCLASLRDQAGRILVVGAAAGADRCEPEGIASVPALRMWALRAAETAYVGFVEDTARAGPGWGEAACEALASPGVAAVGGPVSISPQLPARYKALGLCEYAAFTPPPAGDPDGRSPSGLGFAVDREAALSLFDPAQEGLLFEGEAFDRLRAGGQAVRYVPGMALCYAAAYPEGARLTTRYQHGRLYAGRRVAGRSLGSRLALALAAPLLPVLLTFRTLSCRRRETGLSAATVLWVLAMHSAWAWGELVGYATGRIGDSLASWR